MKIPLVLALSAFVSLSASAESKPVSVTNLRCQVSLEHSVKVTPQQIQILRNSQSLYRVTDSRQLYIDGVKIHLTKQQQSLLDQYYRLIQELAPQISVLVSQGLTLVKQAISSLLNGLTDDNKSASQVEYIANQLEQRLAPLINQPAGQYLLSTELTGSNPEEFSKIMAQELKQLASVATAEILALLGQMIVTGQASWQDAQKKLQQFSQQLNLQGAELEQQANQLCQKIEQLDALEHQLHQSIPQLAEFNVVNIKSI
ncbi:MAG: DUF2884 family protein [Gammaproteobacteria bacterium]|nr:DUF2884 family protein [Gammaproteobacteria bacterium]